MALSTRWIQKYYQVLIDSQTYLNLLYLLLSFPLGLAYFIFLVVGFSLGFGLLIIWVGILLLAAVLASIWLLSKFERRLAQTLLRSSIPVRSQPQTAAGIWPQMRAYLTHPSTLRSLLFLVLKFPVGLITFVLLVTLVSIPLGLLFSPLFYQWMPITFFFWHITTFTDSVVACIFGLILTPLALHALNHVAYWHGRLAEELLS